MAVMPPDNPVAHKSVARYMAAMNPRVRTSLIPGFAGELRSAIAGTRGRAICDG